MKVQLKGFASSPVSRAALDAFIHHLEGTTSPNPIGPGRVFVHHDGGALIDAHLFSDHIWLKELRAIPEQRRGHGSAALGYLCNLADTFKVPIVLTPRRVGKEGMTGRQLRQWYAKFGFVTKGSEMRREPKGEA